MIRLALVVLLQFPFACIAQPAVVLRDGSTKPLEQMEVGSAGVQGVVGGVPRLVTWDRVRGLQGVDATGAQAYLSAGEALWRGITRLDRGDAIAAIEPLESAFDTFAGFDGATTSIAADALLAARLRLGEAEGSVLPWVVRLEQDIRLLEPPAGRRVDLDPMTRLVPTLPPVFVGGRKPGAAAAELADGGFDRWTEGPNRRLAELYASAMLIAVGEDPPVIPDDVDDAGIRLVRAMVVSRHSDPALREAARRELRRFLAETEQEWTRAWCHAGIGLSLLQESGSQRLAGVGHLLMLPSRYAESQPYLAGVCLAEAAVVLYETGRTETARALADELDVQFPLHPVRRMPALRAIRTLRTAETNGTGP